MAEEFKKALADIESVYAHNISCNIGDYKPFDRSTYNTIVKVFEREIDSGARGEAKEYREALADIIKVYAHNILCDSGDFKPFVTSTYNLAVEALKWEIYRRSEEWHRIQESLDEFYGRKK